MSGLQFTFEDYRLCKLDFKLKEVKHQKGAIDINQSLQCQHQVKDAIAEVFLTVLLDGDQAPFILEISYLGIFKFSENLNDVDEQKRKKIIQVNCAAVLFPFIRESIAEITRKAGLQPLLLSSFNFLKAFEEHKQEKRIGLSHGKS